MLSLGLTPALALSSLLLLAAQLGSCDVITQLKSGTIYSGKTSGTRYLSLLGDTENKLISTSFASLGRCPEEYGLGSPCVTFKLAPDGQLDDMDHHPGATERQRNFLASPDLDDDGSNTVSWNMMLEKASAQPGFFHLAQIIGDGGPSWTMSVLQKDKGDIVAILDATVSNSVAQYGDEAICDSMSLTSFMSGESDDYHLVMLLADCTPQQPSPNGNLSLAESSRTIPPLGSDQPPDQETSHDVPH